jgi:hypothetical protein
MRDSPQLQKHNTKDTDVNSQLQPPAKEREKTPKKEFSTVFGIPTSLVAED